MRHSDSWSPRSAELYFSNSLLGQMSELIAQALTPRRERRRAGEADAAINAPIHAPTQAPRMSLLDRLDAWFWRQAQSDRDAYLARSYDVFDLERRIQALDRGGIGARYY